MSNVISLSPFRCRIWAEHERLEEYITEESCKAEIESVAAHGQRIPVLGRPIKNDPMFDVELIYGARRLFVAKHLNIPIRVEVREMSEQEAAIALDMENRHRKDVSPYERGHCYARWLRAGYFKSQEEISQVLGISASQVSRTLKLARLPSVIVNAFASPLDIPEVWGLDLHRAWQDKRRQRSLIEAARAVAKELPRPSPEKVYERLITQSMSGRNERVKAHDEVVKDECGKPLFRVRYYRKSVAIVLDVERLSRKSLSKLKGLVADILLHASSQVVSTPEVFPAEALQSAKHVASISESQTPT